MEGKDITEIAVLFKRRQDKVTTAEGIAISVRGLSFGEMADINTASGGDATKQTMAVITRGTVSPRLSYDQVRELNSDVVKLLVDKILELSVPSAT